MSFVLKRKMDKVKQSTRVEYWKYFLIKFESSPLDHFLYCWSELWTCICLMHIHVVINAIIFAFWTFYFRWEIIQIKTCHESFGRYGTRYCWVGEYFLLLRYLSAFIDWSCRERPLGILGPIFRCHQLNT